MPVVTQTSGGQIQVQTSPTTTTTTSTTNHAPTVANAIGSQSGAQGTAFSFTFAANTFADVDNDTLSYTATLADGSALPAWLQFNAATRTFSGTPANGDVTQLLSNGALSIKVTANDGHGGTVFTTFNLAVANINDAPTVANALSGQTATQGAAFTYQVPANTFSDVDIQYGDSLTYSATLSDGSALPTWLHFNAATGTFTGTPANADVIAAGGNVNSPNGSLLVKVTATDSHGASANSTFALVVANVNDTPTANSIPADSQHPVSSSAAATVIGNVNNLVTNGFVNDADLPLGDTLSYSISQPASGAIVSIDQAGNVLYDPNHAFDNLGYNNTATDSFTYTVTDSHGAHATANISVSLLGADIAPVVAISNVTGLTNGVRVIDEDLNNTGRIIAFNGAGLNIANGTATSNQITVSDADSANFSGGSLTVSILSSTAQSATLDHITVKTSNNDGSVPFRIANGNLYYDPNDTINGSTGNAVSSDLTNAAEFQIGTIDQAHKGLQGDSLVIHLNANATPAIVQLLAGQIVFTVQAGLPNSPTTTQDWALAAGNRVIEFTVNDGLGGVANATRTLSIVSENDPPVANQANINIAAPEGMEVSYQFPSNAFSDADLPHDTLTYSAAMQGGGSLPAWLNFDASTRTFSGIAPANEGPATLHVVVTATDSANASASFTLNLSIGDTIGTPGADILVTPAVNSVVIGDPTAFAALGAASNNTVNTVQAAVVPVAQIEHVGLNNVYDLNDVIHVQIGNTSLDYTVSSATQTASSVGNGIAQLINTSGLHNAGYTAAFGANSQSVVVTGPAGTSFNVVTSVSDSYVSNFNVTPVDTQMASNGQNAVAEVATITVGGTAGDIADTYTVQVSDTNGVVHTITYVTDGTEQGLNGITQGLTNAIASATDDQGQHFNLPFSVVNNGNGTITLTATTPGVGFTVAASGANAVAGAADSSATPVVVQPNVVATPAATQVDTVTIGGSVGSHDAGDTYVITVDDGNGHIYTTTYQTTGQEANIDDVASGIITAINAGGDNLDLALTNLLTATYNGNGQIVLTAHQPGVGFTTAVSAANSVAGVNDSSVSQSVPVSATTYVAPQAQVDTIDFFGGQNAAQQFDANEVIHVNVNDGNGNHLFNYTVQLGDTAATIVNSFVTQITNAGLNVTAANVNNTLTVTANNAGTALTTSASVTEVLNTLNTAPAASPVTAAGPASDSIITLDLGTAVYDKGDTIHVHIGGANAGVADGTYAVTGAENSVATAVANYIANHNYANVANVQVLGDGHTIEIDANSDATATTVGNVISATATVGNTSFYANGAPYLSGPPGFQFPANNDFVSLLTSADVNIARVDDIDITGAVNPGDQFTVNVNGHASSFTVTNYTNNVATVNANTTNAAPATVAVAQVDTVSFTGTVSPTNTFTVTINGHAHTYTAAPGASMTAVINGLVSLINADAAVNGVVTASRSSTTLLIAEKVPGAGGFTTTAATTNGGTANVIHPTADHPATPAVSQVTDIDLHNTAYDVGDVVTITVAGHQFSHTVDGNNIANNAQLVNAFVNDINGIAGYGAVANGNVITVTGIAGVSFTASAGVQNVQNDLSLSHVVNGLAAAINNNGAVNGAVQASVVNGHLELTSLHAGTDFTDSINVTGGQQTAITTAQANHTLTQQQTDIHVQDSLHDFDPGDAVTVTVAGVTIHETVNSAGIIVGHNVAATAANMATALAADIHTATGLTAVNNGGAVVHVTGDAQGDAFNASIQIHDATAHNNGNVNSVTATPAVDAPAQVTHVDFGNQNFDAGDIVSVTIGGTVNAYTVQPGDTEALVVQGLVNAITNNGANGMHVSGSTSTGFDLTGNAGDTVYNVTTGIQNTGYNTNVTADTTPTAAVQLVNAVAQVDTITFANDVHATPDVGDAYSLTIAYDSNGDHAITGADSQVTISYVLDGTEADVNAVVGHLASLINADPNLSPLVTATVNGTDLIITSDVAGTPFQVSNISVVNAQAGANDNGLADANVTPNAMLTPQVSTVSLDAGSLNPGDVVKVAFDLDSDGVTEGWVATTVHLGESANTVLAHLAGQVVLNQPNTTSHGQWAGNLVATVDNANHLLVLTQTNANDGSFIVTPTVTDVVADNHASESVVASTAGVAQQAQVSTVTIGAGAYDAGDQILIQLDLDNDGHTDVSASYTAQVGDTAQTVASALAARIAHTQPALALGGAWNGNLTASATNGVISISQTDPTDGAFSFRIHNAYDYTPDNTLTAAAGAHVAAAGIQNQISTVTLNANSMDVGDVVQLDIGNVHASHTVTLAEHNAMDYDGVLADLASQISGGNPGGFVGHLTASEANQTLSISQTVPADGSFTVTPTVVDVTLDNNFSASGTTSETSGSANLTVVRSAALAQVQQETLQFAGATFDAGDAVTITINGHVYTHNPTAGESLNAVVNGLIAAVGNSEPTVTLTNSGGGLLTVTEVSAATGGFTLSSAVNDVAVTNNNALINPAQVQAAQTPQASVAQVSTVSFTGTVDIGDHYNVVVNGTTFTYTAVAGATMTTVINNLKAQINADVPLPVTAVRSGSTLILSADTAGTAFTVSATSTDQPGGANVATPTANVSGHAAQTEHDTIDFGAANFDAGDTVNVIIQGNQYTYHVASAMTSDQMVQNFVTQFGSQVPGVTLSWAGGGTHTLDIQAVNGNYSGLFLAANVNDVAVTANGNPVQTQIHANVPATLAQIDDLRFSADHSVNPGDSVSVTVNGHTYSVTADVGATVDTLGAALAAAITGDIATNHIGSASYNAANNTLTITGAADGSTFTASFNVAQASQGNGTETVLTPTVNAPAPVAQVDHVVLSGTADPGDVIHVVVNGHDYHYTVPVGGTLVTAAANLAGQINTDVATNLIASAVSNGVDTITLTGAISGNAGVSFTVNSSVNQVVDSNAPSPLDVTTVHANVANATQQVVQIAVNHQIDIGDTFEITVSGTPYSYAAHTGDSATMVATALANVVNTAGGHLVSTTSNNNVVTLTGLADGTVFTFNESVTNIQVTNGSPTVNVPTPNNPSPTAQVDAVTFVGANTLEPNGGDIFGLDFNGTPISYTSQAGDSWYDILSGLGDQLDVNGLGGVDVDWAVVATGHGGNDAQTYKLVLTAHTPGTPFTVTNVTATNLAAGAHDNAASSAPSNAPTTANVVQVMPQSQVGHVDLGATALDAGDVVTITVDSDNNPGTNNSVVFNYTVTGNEGGNAAIATIIANQINGAGTVAPITAGHAGTVVTLTGDAQGDAFGFASHVTNVVLHDNSGNITDITTTPNQVTVPAVAEQVNVVVTQGTSEFGDTYTVDIDPDGNNGNAAHIVATYVTSAGDTVTDIANGLKDAIDLDVHNLSPVDGVSTGFSVQVVQGQSGLFDTLAITGALVADPNLAGHPNNTSPFTVTESVVNRPVGLHNDNTAIVSHTQANQVQVAAQVQHETVQIVQGTPDVGDVYSITIDPDGAGPNAAVTGTYQTLGGETASDIAFALQGDLVAHGLAGVTVSVTGLNSDTLDIVANQAGTPFTVSTNVANRAAGATADNSASANIGTPNVPHINAQPQITDIDIGASGNAYYNVNDVIHVVIGGNDVAYTVQSGESNASIVNNLVAAINNNGNAFAIAHASNNSGVLELTGTNHNAFVVTESVVNGGQINTVSDSTVQSSVTGIGQQTVVTFDANDVLSTNGQFGAYAYVAAINGQYYAYNADGSQQVASVAAGLNGLANVIQNAGLGITAAVGTDGNGHETLTLTSAPGVSFTAAGSAVHAGTADDITLGAGSDSVVFTNFMAADTINNFVSGQDQLVFDFSAFRQLSYNSNAWTPTSAASGAPVFDDGTLRFDWIQHVSAQDFVSGVDHATAFGAETANTRFVYDQQTGHLFYDMDGTGAVFSPVLIANLGQGTQLSVNDLQVAIEHGVPHP